MATRTEKDKHAGTSADRLQKAWVLHDHKEADVKTNEIGGVSIRIQLCH